MSAVAPVLTSDDHTIVAFQVVPTEGPTSVSTEQLVNDIRAASPLPGGITLGVAGQTSAGIDISQKLADALPVYLAVVVGLSLLIMILVFRSLLVPLVATGGFVLSLFAALGGTVAIYQWGWLGGLFGVSNPGPILNFLPDHARRHPLRPGDGLHAVPGLGHARGVRPRGARRARRSSSASRPGGRS